MDFVNHSAHCYCGYGAVVSCIMASMLAAQPRQPDAAGDWPMYSRDLAGTRYAPLTQVNTQNVARLVRAWYYRLPERGAEEVTPIAVGGILYLPAGNRVVALDGDTGKEIWGYALPDGPIRARGVAYWPGDGDHPRRILFTAGRKMIALEAATGRPDVSFGTGGVVDLIVGYNGVPTIYKNMVVIGATVGELPTGPPGNSRAYDARTGAKLWEFHSIPQAGEVGHETWLNDGWKGRSGTNVWGWYMTVDEARGLVYMPFGGPSPNYYGGDRPGAGLFANSLVAVDALTGKLRWYFQTVHHDLWDSDLPPAPGLVEIVRDGKTIPALAQIGKTGWMFILNRETGEPVFGVEERPVPKGDVPGEWYSPTQPFPVKPPALARVSFRKDDIVTAEDTTPEHARACLNLWYRYGGLDNQGPFTPFPFHPEGAPAKSAIQFPGGTGGVNWGGTATHPQSRYIFLQTHDDSQIGWIEKAKPGGSYGRERESNQPYDRGSVEGTGPFHHFSAPAKDANGVTVGTWPCQKPPWSRLLAVNANTGEIAWQTPLGITEALPDGKRNTAMAGSSGPIVTAGGLVFIGATDDNRFRAFDAMNGKELWAVKLGHVADANPMTYLSKGGSQYVAVVATNSLVSFALP